DELVYNWSVSGGWISGFGSSILWTPPNATGTYTITCTVDDRPLFIGPHDKGTRNDEMVIKSIQVQVPPRVWSDGAPIGRMLDEDGVEMVEEDGNPREDGRIIAPQATAQDPARPVRVKVRPGGVLSCAVEAASDWDHWSRGVQ